MFILWGGGGLTVLVPLTLPLLRHSLHHHNWVDVEYCLERLVVPHGTSGATTQHVSTAESVAAVQKVVGRLRPPRPLACSACHCGPRPRS
eukprot:3568648-Rhodomonas_salina.1